MPTTDDDHLDRSRMSLGEHLEQLRHRLILSLVGVVATAGASLVFGKRLVAWLCAPLIDAQHAAGVPAQAYVMSPITGFAVYLKVSVIAGVILALPWVLYQVWRFFEPGLYAGERRAVLLLAPFSAVMTALGVAFLYHVMLPLCLWFLISFSTTFPVPDVDGSSLAFMGYQAEPGAPNHAASGRLPNGTEPIVTVPVLTGKPSSPVEGQVWLNPDRRELNVHVHGHTRTIPLHSGTLVSPLIEVSGYINFVAVMAMGLVVAFQLPVAMVIVGSWGLVDPEVLSKYRGYCIFVCFAAGALLTPPDVLSMILLAVPLWTLFEFGLLLMRMTYRKRSQPAD